MILPDSLFDEEVGVSCSGGLPAWALVEYVSSVESREATETNQLQRSFSIQLESVVHNVILKRFHNVMFNCHIGSQSVHST